MRGPVVIGGDELPSPAGIGLTDLPNIGGARLGLNPEEEGFNFYDVQIARRLVANKSPDVLNQNSL